ncbi:hypothetical protein Tco_1448078 [Tanacetum coccineum]
MKSAKKMEEDDVVKEPVAKRKKSIPRKSIRKRQRMEEIAEKEKLKGAFNALAKSNVVNYSETEITNDSNIIPYSQYVIETQQEAVQNSNSSAQQDALILSLERYKEQVKVLKEGQNVDLNSKDNVSDSFEQSEEIDRLKQTLSEHLKEKESLMQTKAQQLEPKLYDDNVIKNTTVIVIPDFKETLMLAE